MDLQNGATPNSALPQLPQSPTSSDAGSALSDSLASTPKRSEGLRRLGTLQGAGLTSLNLALSQENAHSSTSAGLSGFNAISTLLNNPNKPQRPIDPSSSRYPPISQSHTDIPKVKRKDIEGHITSIKAEWDRYRRSQRLGIRGKARLEGDESPITEADEKQDVSTRMSIDDDASARTLGNKRLPPLSTVPQVFFAEDFHLGNPYTFDLVTERYKHAGSVPQDAKSGAGLPGYDVALNQMLQEKLSYYSDVVEQHLILEISARSSSFFAALGDLQDLEEESKSCLEKVEYLKSELKEKDEGIAKAGLRVISEQAKRRENEERLDAVTLLHQLCEKRDLCQLLVQNSEWTEALTVMTDLENVISGKSKLTARTGNLPSALTELDLPSIPAVQGLAPQIVEIRESIAAQLEVELQSIVASDLDHRIGRPHEDAAKPSSIEPSLKAMENVATEEVDQKLDDEPKINRTLSNEDGDLFDRVSVHMHGLVRTEGVDRAIAEYKNTALNSIRVAMRKYLCESPAVKGQEGWKADLATLLEDDDAASGRPDARLGPGGIEAASKLRELAHEDFLGLLRTLCKGMSQSIQAVESQRQVFIHILDKEARQSTSTNGEQQNTPDILMPEGVSPSLPTILSGIVTEVCSLTHVFASRLLSLRSSTLSTLSLQDFLSVFHQAWTFILTSEKICGRMIIGLRGVVLNQAKAWLSNFHRQRIEKAAKGVEEEQWSPGDISYGQQANVELIIESATADPKVLVIPKDSIQNRTESQGEQEKADAQESFKTLKVEDKQYFLVPASVDVLCMLIDYLRVVINLPLLSTEIMARLVEFLKQFNSRTCQVVLGAGAMRSAGLKNITARHLALASQSLSVMITLIPYIREAVRRHLNPRQAVMLVEFDKLKRDYQEHQYEIHAKLVAIMSDRLTVHSRSLAKIQWDAPLQEIPKEGLVDDQAKSSSVVNPSLVKPISELIRETTVLHKVLCKYLQPPVVEQVIGQVLDATDKRVAGELDRVEGHSEAVKTRVTAVRDAFRESFGAMRYMHWEGKGIDEVVDKILKRQPAERKSEDRQATRSPPSSQNPLPTAYKPRINIFGRRNLPNESPQTSGRNSIDSQIPSNRETSTPRLSSDTVREKAPVVSSRESDTHPPKEGHAETEISLPEADTATQPSVSEVIEAPATPRKDDDEKLPTNANVIEDEKDLHTQELKDVASLRTSPPPTPTKIEQTHEVSSSSEKAPQVPPTPTSGRLTLQQRLAEAARKRAQANSSGAAMTASSSHHLAGSKNVDSSSLPADDVPSVNTMKDVSTGDANENGKNSMEAPPNRALDEDTHEKRELKNEPLSQNDSDVHKKCDVDHEMYADQADNADQVTNADQADNADQVNSADQMDNADQVNNADPAKNADQARLVGLTTNDTTKQSTDLGTEKVHEKTVDTPNMAQSGEEGTLDHEAGQEGEAISEPNDINDTSPNSAEAKKPGKNAAKKARQKAKKKAQKQNATSQ